MAADPINVYDDLLPVYGEATEAAKKRYETIKAAFVERFGAPPEAYARSPGRVNLIGEHIDYEGYGVLPMALAVDTVVAIRKGGDQLVVCNVDADKYPEKTFSVDPAQEVDVGKHNWGNYFLAAYKGVFEHLEAKGERAPAPVGLQIMIQGTVPTGAGVSSSAAIVCASALAIISQYGLKLSQQEVSEFTAKAERYVGVTSGGMDQAISIMGMPGIAKMVEFNPVRASDVELPEGSVFVVANSLAVSNKAESATKHYNLRVVECRLAAGVLAVLLGETKESARKVLTLKEVEPLIESKYSGPKASTSGAQLAAVQEQLHEGAYSTEEIEGVLGAKLTDLYEGNASALRVLEANDSFELRKRALHVYAEKQRVPDFRDVCNSGAPVGEKLTSLGKLMDESHASCRDLYECSSPELDALVQVNKGAGAIGSRLTGAGWGGCTVSLVREGDVDAFIEKVKTEYFQPLIEAGRTTEEELSQHIFASKPASGGAVLNIKL